MTKSRLENNEGKPRYQHTPTPHDLGALAQYTIHLNCGCSETINSADNIVAKRGAMVWCFHHERNVIVEWVSVMR